MHILVDLELADRAPRHIFDRDVEFIASRFQKFLDWRNKLGEFGHIHIGFGILYGNGQLLFGDLLHGDIQGSLAVQDRQPLTDTPSIDAAPSAPPLVTEAMMVSPPRSIVKPAVLPSSLKVRPTTLSRMDSGVIFWKKSI